MEAPGFSESAALDGNCTFARARDTRATTPKTRERFIRHLMGLAIRQYVCRKLEAGGIRLSLLHERKGIWEGFSMDRRTFLSAGAAVGLAGLAKARQVSGQDDATRFPKPAALSFSREKSGLKIAAIRAGNLVPTRPLPRYQPTPGYWNTTDVEIANPLSIYPKFKPRRSLFYADDLGPTTVMVETDMGVTGYGYGGPGTAYVAEKHLPKLLVGEDPLDVERGWDIMWRGALYYGGEGVAVHGVSG